MISNQKLLTFSTTELMVSDSKGNLLFILGRSKFSIFFNNLEKQRKITEKENVYATPI